MVTDEQREKLCNMLFFALLEIRGLGNNGKTQQAADLADAFHNLPVYLWTEDFSFAVFREFLQAYQQRYAETGCYDYLTMLDEVIEKAN
jgi:hypothetical protein